MSCLVIQYPERAVAPCVAKRVVAETGQALLALAAAFCSSFVCSSFVRAVEVAELLA